MLPVESGVIGRYSGIVLSRLDMSQEDDGDARAVAVAVGSEDTGGRSRAVRAHARGSRAHELPDRAAGRRGTACPRDRLAGATWPPPGAQSAAAVRDRGAGGPVPAHGAAGRHAGHAGLAARTAAGDRAGPAHGRRRQRGLDHAAAGHLPGRGYWPSDGDRGRPSAPASAGLRVQASHLESQAQVDRAGGVGKKRVRVEALLAAAASPVPPPLPELMPDLLLDEAVPEDLPWLLRLLPRADLYLQDEVEVALHPTLTRVWCRKGRRGQRLVEAPGNTAKEYGFGLVDWRDGRFDWRRAPKRSAPPVCAQLRRAVERSQARGRIALVLLDHLGIHTPKGSLLLRALLDELRGQLVLVYTPPYDPEANRIEWLWRALRRAVTHTHTRETLPPLLEDADAWARTISPTEILHQIGSPFADADLIDDQPLSHAA